ncbi:hypothetical protein CDL12_20297 [Handroanthus impetiginosus]|uniref:Uncharacterized protein n=1 Tax=Handroanthus impetiginosus TaxID=429701 RepID=A0A2G9GPF1_9LAMI|nr:hypothetical protein CDL12_20297 [Handroanthus impetiginosus]
MNYSVIHFHFSHSVYLFMYLEVNTGRLQQCRFNMLKDLKHACFCTQCCWKLAAGLPFRISSPVGRN